MSTFPLQVSSRGGGAGGGGGAGAGATAGRSLLAGASAPRPHDDSVVARTSVRATSGRARPERCAAIRDPPLRAARSAERRQSARNAPAVRQRREVGDFLILRLSGAPVYG